ncbi:ABC transporter substrate-binding protein [Gammaproteobacteria bacterium AB-CW1]|uniref:ABC transporter substrate-binding protein n=1 Tax=Natronospira elongata TaxID=3110268 RepID=A0AAP6MLQ3_9GAMM|nr:ABC transporter substrate-binding protein [Gammaproteobacteria bacterium AB-CW1]
MQSRIIQVLTTAMAAAVLALPASSLAEEDSLPDPAVMVEETAHEILRELRERQDEMQDDPSAAYQFVEDLLLPVFDLPYATRLVLGRHGRDASPQQRRDFGEAFYRFLVRSYSDALVDQDLSEIEIEVRPTRGEPDPSRTRVRTEVVRDDASNIPVDFALRYTDDGWKVFDVTIEGVSYVTNYRNSFDSEIRQRGIDAVIERLRDRTRRKEQEMEESIEQDNG